MKNKKYNGNNNNNDINAFEANKNIHIEDNLLILLISCLMFLKLFNKKITKIK